ncbi:FHA domain-containing protein [Terrabacter sp. GCM10028922]|uniref:FHA domain-containing protein n=1 Tax=Terrabacter sp. GCM10028922 TaxID=3273428 RepID=UPI00361E4DE9
MSAVCPNGHTSEADDYCDTCGSPIDASAQPAGGASSTGAAAAPAATGSSLDLDAPGVPAGPGPGDGGSGDGGPAAPSALVCPNCNTENPDGALFCEACGYDFTTGAMPRDAAGAGEPGSGQASTAPGVPSGDVVGGGVDGGVAAGGVAAGGAAEAGGNGSGDTSFEWLAEVWVDPDWYQTQEAEDPCPSPGLPTIMPLRHRSVLLGRVSTSKNTHPEIDLSSDPGVSRRHAQLTTDGSRWFVEDLGSSNGTFVGPASGPLPERPIAVGPKTELDDDDRLYVGAWTRVVVRRATSDEVEAYA